MNPLTRRSVTAGLGAAVAAIPAVALATPTLASVGEDAELRELCAKYLVQLEAVNQAVAILVPRRDAYDLEHEADRIAQQLERHQYWQTLSQKRLWKKHGLDPLYRAANREDTKLRRIVRAIREVKATSLFGIGVKLSAWEDLEDISDDEFAEVVDGVRRDIADLIAVDFIAATGELEA